MACGGHQRCIAGTLQLPPEGPHPGRSPCHGSAHQLRGWEHQGRRKRTTASFLSRLQDQGEPSLHAHEVRSRNEGRRLGIGS